MDEDQIKRLLESVRGGTVAIADAAKQLAAPATDDLGFARLDRDRARRCGFPEVVFGPGKAAEHVVAIMARLAETESIALATRLDHEQIEAIQKQLPAATIDRVARIAWLGTMPEKTVGRVRVISAGTSDLPVAREAELTARALGAETTLIVDVGVAGLHRLLERMVDFKDADAIVVVAGMEGALPSVVGGLVDCPVIAVPTSIGYGANFQGLSALLCGLTSCAASVAVVNIDAGFCGGFVAGLIARAAGSIPTLPQ